MKFLSKVAVLALLAVSTGSLVAQERIFDTWPAGASPQEVGKRVAEHFSVEAHVRGVLAAYEEALRNRVR